jgi:hypothetical protein
MNSELLVYMKMRGFAEIRGSINPASLHFT